MNFRQKVFFITKIFGRVILGAGILLVILGLIGVYDVLHPPRLVPPGYTLVEENINFQKVDLFTKDNIRLTAWYTPSENGTVILLAHGYGDNRPEWVHAMLAKRGYGVLAWDARAHGESDGDISTIGYSEILDVSAALNYALSQPEVLHIGAWGGSMGGATMIRAAAEFSQIEALVVDSSFSSLNEEIDFLAPYPLVNPMAKFFMGLFLGVNLKTSSPLELIGKISPRPVYIIQGSGDSVASPKAAEELYNAAGEPRYLWTEDNVIHLGMYINNPRKYQRRVVDFFDENLLNKNP
ncbi:MAG: alpha/beta hydrolase [Anaerolineales bacterium]|nr:alpha/beta hydrolase [Anaerolineales bacterium]